MWSAQGFPTCKSVGMRLSAVVMLLMPSHTILLSQTTCSLTWSVLFMCAQTVSRKHSYRARSSTSGTDVLGMSNSFRGKDEPSP